MFHATSWTEGQPTAANNCHHIPCHILDRGTTHSSQQLPSCSLPHLGQRDNPQQPTTAIIFPATSWTEGQPTAANNCHHIPCHILDRETTHSSQQLPSYSMPHLGQRDNPQQPTTAIIFHATSWTEGQPTAANNCHHVPCHRTHATVTHLLLSCWWLPSCRLRGSPLVCREWTTAQCGLDSPTRRNG